MCDDYWSDSSQSWTKLKRVEGVEMDRKDEAVFLLRISLLELIVTSLCDQIGKQPSCFFDLVDGHVKRWKELLDEDTRRKP